MECWTCWREWPTAACSLLNLVECVAALPEDKRDLEQIKAAPCPVLVTDKDGDSHYELARPDQIHSRQRCGRSSLLFGLPQKAARPRFVCRRLILSASEDVGTGRPRRSALAVACQQAVGSWACRKVSSPSPSRGLSFPGPKKATPLCGLPQCRARVKLGSARPMPLHLRNPSTQMQKEWGYGKIQISPQLPRFLGGTALSAANWRAGAFTSPRDNGEEPRLSQWWRKIHKIKKTDEQSQSQHVDGVFLKIPHQQALPQPGSRAGALTACCPRSPLRPPFSGARSLALPPGLSGRCDDAAWVYASVWTADHGTHGLPH